MARVLIAEADEPTRQQVVSFLRSAGHDVTAYSDGDAVLDHIVSGHVDIIVTDLELPGPGGLELLCRVRGSRPEIKVLLTAEKPTFESAAEAVRTGAFDFLVKPVTRQAICRAVGSAERIKALEDENRNYRNQLEELVRERTRQIREYSDRLRLVADRTRRLTSCQSLHELGVELLDLLSASLGADGGSFYVVRDNTLQLVHALDPGHQKASISLPAPEDSVIAHVFARNRGVLVETIEDSTLGIASSGWDGYKDGSLLALPFFNPDGEIQGAIGLHNKHLPPFTPQDLEVGQIIVLHGVEAFRNILLADRVRKSEDRYRAISERSLTGIVVHEDGILRYVNSRLLSMLGYSEQEESLIVGRDLLEFVHEADRPTVRKNIQKRVNGQPVPQEYAVRLLTRSGETIWVEVLVSSIQADSGRVQFLVHIINITDRQRATEALRRSEETFRALAENSLDIVFRLDQEGRVLYVNPAVEAPVGLTPQQIIGRNLWDLKLPEALSTSLFEAVRHVFKHGTVSRFDLQTPEGEWFDCMLMPEFLGDMEVKAVIGSARDITESKLAQEVELRRFRRIQRQQTLVKDLATHPAVAGGEFEKVVSLVTESVASALEVDRAAVWMLGSDGNCLECIDCFERSTSSHSYAPGRGIAKLGNYIDALREVRAIAAIDAYSDPRTHELADACLSSSDVHSLLDSAIRIRGKVVGVLSHEQGGEQRNWQPEEVSFTAEVADQLSQTLLNRERQTADQEKIELEEQLRQSQKMEAIGRLAGGVAHDFNNLLTAIEGYSEIVLNSIRQTDPLRKDVQEIRKAADRATALTQQLLAFSRKQSIEPRVMDLNERILDSRAMLERVVGEDVELLFELCAEAPLILADPHQIDQVLLNLVANARDAMPDGGKLMISTRLDTERQEEGRLFSDSDGGEIVVLTLRDSGLGMDEATRKRIFEPFFTTKEKGKGTGLGLATVYGIVQQNNGSISVHSEEGHGTTFEICFARSSEEQAPTEPSAAAAGRPRGQGTILLVEDETTVRSLTRKVLSTAGYTVIEAEGGDEALAVSADYDGEIDLLLTDVIMPNLNGKELHQRLILSRPTLKVLFMSGYTEDVISTRGVIEAGLPFIQKPFSIETICQKVAEVLD
ncbi:MAG: PAS domain S-box protein [Acidobacteriota bacterium]